MKSNKTDDNDVDNPEKWMTSADSSRHTSEWIGAIFFHLLNLGRNKFNDDYSHKNARRNIWVGILLQILALAVMIVLAVKYM